MRRVFIVSGYFVAYISLLLIIDGCNSKSDKKKADLPTSITSKTALNEDPIPEYIAEGKKIYNQYCLSCHQSSGEGVAYLNPPLKQTEYVLGDKERLINIILKGSNIGLEVNGTTYSNSMPPHAFLDDQQVANVLSYIRNSFGNKAEPVTEAEVKMVRES